MQEFKSLPLHYAKYKKEDVSQIWYSGVEIRTVTARKDVGKTQGLAGARRDPASAHPLISARRDGGRRLKKITDDMISECLRDPQVQCRQDIADKLGICLESADRHLKEMGISIPRTLVHKPQRNLFEVGHDAWNRNTGIGDEGFRQAHELGLSQPQAADYLGCSQSRVWLKWKELGLRTPGKANPDYVKGRGFSDDGELIDDVCRAYAQGLKVKDTAEQYGIPEDRVVRIWKQNGFTQYIN